MKKLSILMVLALLGSCAQQPSATVVDEATTQRVLDHHMQTFNGNDLEGVMADYTEASVLITPDRTYKGLAEIRENFVNAFAALPTDGTTFTMTKSVVVGNVAYIIWKATTPTLEFKFATDTFVIQDGKIVSQTYAGDVVAIAAAENSGD